MLTLDQENRILKAAPPHLRVGIILLVQTGGRTYSEGFRLRWDQVDWEHRLIRLGNDVKTPGSSEPLPLTDLAYRVLSEWKQELGPDFSLCLSKSAQTASANHHRKDSVEGHAKASGRAALSDLQLAACFLYAPELGSSTRRCDSTGHASHQPRDEAPVSTQHRRASP